MNTLLKVILIIYTIIIAVGIIKEDTKKKIGFEYVDLPEEYKAISKSSKAPDTMIAYQRNDTLFLGFKH